MKTLLYPKTYGIITDYFFEVYRVKYPYAKRRVSVIEWHKESDTAKHKWAIDSKTMRLRIKLDNGNSLEIDALGYQGRKFQTVGVGKRVKVYRRPQDRRGFVYKLTGE